HVSKFPLTILTFLSIFLYKYVYHLISHSFWYVLACFFTDISVGSKCRIAFCAFYNRIGKIANMSRSYENTLAHYLRTVNFQHAITSDELFSPKLNEFIFHANSPRTIFPKTCWSIAVDFTAWEIKPSF